MAMATYIHKPPHVETEDGITYLTFYDAFGQPQLRLALTKYIARYLGHKLRHEDMRNEGATVLPFDETERAEA